MSELKSKRDGKRVVRRLKGSCLCGDVRYTVADAFEYAMICHCSQCRRATGSAFKPFGGIDRKKLKVTRVTTKRYGDANTHDAHCRRCVRCCIPW